MRTASPRGATRTRKGGAFFLIAPVLTVLTCLFLIVPIGMSILAGVTENYFIGVRSGLTLRWVGEVWSLYRETIFLSIQVALATLLVTLLIGVPLGYVLARSKQRWVRALEEALVLPVAMPGLATGLALVLAFGTFRDFRSSWLFILVGHVLFTLPFMARSVAAVLASINLPVLEEAAASLGAGFLRRFTTIVIPNARGGILAGALMVVTLSMGEFNITWMLHTPLTKTLPVGLADSYASMRLEIGSAYTLVFLLMTVPLLIAMQWLSARGARNP